MHLDHCGLLTELEMARLFIQIADQDHENSYALIGNYIDHRECHIEPNWLIIYRKESDTIIFVRTGTHADPFK